MTPQNSNSALRDAEDVGTVIVSPSVRIGLLRACAYLADKRDEEREAASAGAVNIRTKRRVMAGALPSGVPLYIIAADLKASNDDILLAASELVKLGHLQGRPDVRPIISGCVRITDAGREWIRKHDEAQQSPSRPEHEAND